MPHLRYVWYVIRHKWFVFVAGLKTKPEEAPRGSWIRLGSAVPVVCKCCNHYVRMALHGYCRQCREAGCGPTQDEVGRALKRFNTPRKPNPHATPWEPRELTDSWPGAEA